jgi:hypothetical protein
VGCEGRRKCPNGESARGSRKRSTNLTCEHTSGSKRSGQWDYDSVPAQEAGNHLAKGEPGQRPDHKPNCGHVGEKVGQLFNPCNLLIHIGHREASRTERGRRGLSHWFTIARRFSLQVVCDRKQ